MVSVGMLVRFQAKPGKERDVAAFLKGALPAAQEEPDTIAWFAVRMGPQEFAVFDVFSDDSGRQVHLAGQPAEADPLRADGLFFVPPVVQPLDVLAAKMPG